MILLSFTAAASLEAQSAPSASSLILVRHAAWMGVGHPSGCRSGHARPAPSMPATSRRYSCSPCEECTGPDTQYVAGLGAGEAATPASPAAVWSYRGDA